MCFPYFYIVIKTTFDRMKNLNFIFIKIENVMHFLSQNNFQIFDFEKLSKFNFS